MTKISVIIPLYNSAGFLPSLFENIRQQRLLPDIEFVFIDDHGRDDSAAVARSLVSGINCVFGATPANLGPGAARNTGLELASGEYVAFLDSDDALDPDFCASLYSAAEEHDADLAYCHIVSVKDGRRSVWRNPMVTGGDFAPNRLSYLKRYKSFFTSYIYRRSFILENGIRFPATRSAEDSCFLTEALLCASRIASVDRAMYCYLQRSDSVSQKKDDGRWQQRMASFDALLEFARGKGLYDQYKDILDYLYIKKAAIGAARNCPAARREIAARLAGKLPQWKRNSYYRRDLACRAAAFALGLR